MIKYGFVLTTILLTALVSLTFKPGVSLANTDKNTQQEQPKDYCKPTSS